MAATGCINCGNTWRDLYLRNGEKWCMTCIHAVPVPPVREQPSRTVSYLCSEGEHDRCTSFQCECEHHARPSSDQRGAPSPVPIRWG